MKKKSPKPAAKSSKKQTNVSGQGFVPPVYGINFVDRQIDSKENKTGLPDKLKEGIENLSGYSMDNVKVHYNSDKPARLQAHAYTQGTKIHVAPGQEEHLPHEAWHTVQQMQGRAKPTIQAKGVAINDDPALESEAGAMGAIAAAEKRLAPSFTQRTEFSSSAFSNIIQRVFKITEWNTLNVKDFFAKVETLSKVEQLNLAQNLKSYYAENAKETMTKPIEQFCKAYDSKLEPELQKLEIFKFKHKYAGNLSFDLHGLYENPTFTLYPIEKSEEERKKMGSYRNYAHRPILDVELVNGKFYARCYLGLFSKGTNKEHKDVTANAKGEISFQNIGLMNLGNPFKALLWCEDYLANKEHDKHAPNPVIRSFLVPLEDASWMLDDDNKEARPLDQDRGAGQFGHPGQTAFFDQKLHPLIGSLVSFFLDVKEYQEKEPNQIKLPMPQLQEYLTGTAGDPRDIRTEGVAAQHGRKGHKATFAEEYEESLQAYYLSVSQENTGFTDATQDTTGAKTGKYVTQRIDLSKFPNLGKLAEQQKSSESKNTSESNSKSKEKESAPEKQAAISRNYLYEDNDIYTILNLMVAQYNLQNVHIIAPVDNIIGAQLTERLREEQAAHQGRARTVLVPYNIGNFHWIGIALEISANEAAVSAFVMDPVQATKEKAQQSPETAKKTETDLKPAKKSSVDEGIIAEIKAIYNAAAVETVAHMIQKDSTSCGVLTIENLIMRARAADLGQAHIEPLQEDLEILAGALDLRRGHSELMTQERPDLNFAHRQRNELYTARSSFDASAYYSGKGKPIEDLRFLKKTVELIQTMKSLQNAKEVQSAFVAIANPNKEINDTLPPIRNQLTTALTGVKQGNDANLKNNFFTLISDLFEIKEKNLDEVNNLQGNKVKNIELVKNIGNYIAKINSSEQAKEFLKEMDASVKKQEESQKKLKEKYDPTKKMKETVVQSINK